MQKVFEASEKLFFDILIVCLVSFIYFNFLPENSINVIIGIILCTLYFGVNFYVGYRYELNLKESLLVGVNGCSLGLFLGFFAIYTQFILNNPDTAVWLMMPYYIPTLVLDKIFTIDINLIYIFSLMGINILLVILGAFTKNIMNKLLHK